MRQKLAFVFGLLGGIAIVSLLRSRRRRSESRLLDPRVEELRRKLAEKRDTGLPRASAVAPGQEPPPAEKITAPVPAAPPEIDVEGARRQIYEEGRAAVEEMRRSGEKPAP